MMAALPAAVAATGVGSTILNTVGEVNTLDAQAKQADYRAKLAERNAGIVEQQTTARVGQQQRQAGEVLGEQRAAIAQSGFGSSGTMLDVASQSGTNAILDALSIRYEGNLKKTELQSEAEMARWEAKQARRAKSAAIGSAMLMAPAQAYLGYAGAGGTFGAKGAGVMRSSAIPGAFKSADEANAVLTPWYKRGF